MNLNTEEYLRKILNSNFFKHQRLQDDFHNKFMNKEYWEWIIEKYDFFFKQFRKTRNCTKNNSSNLAWIKGAKKI